MKTRGGWFAFLGYILLSLGLGLQPKINKALGVLSVDNCSGFETNAKDINCPYEAHSSKFTSEKRRWSLAHWF